MLVAGDEERAPFRGLGFGHGGSGPPLVENVELQIAAQ